MAHSVVFVSVSVSVMLVGRTVHRGDEWRSSFNSHVFTQLKKFLFPRLFFRWILGIGIGF